jgi:8-amino-7-oxononanoate synthase
MSDLWAFAERRLTELEARDRLRTTRPMSTPTGPTVQRDGREYLLFASNDYLGLAGHPKVREAAAEAAGRWGVGAGSARLISGALEIHDELERAIADLKGTEDAVLFSSGYLANLGLQALADADTVIFSDALNHASLIDGIRLTGAHRHIFGHSDLEELRALLHAHRTAKRIIIATDGVFSMDGDIADIPGLAALADDHAALLFVDDAHGTGVVGPEGRGSTTAAPDAIVMGTLSKALGSAGGFIAGTKVMCDLLRNTARSYIFDTAMPAPVAAAGLAALTILRAEPERVERLHHNAAASVARLRQGGLQVAETPSAIIPVVVGRDADALAAAEALEARGILIPAIRPPSVPEGTARLRVTVTSEHSPEQIQRAADAIVEVLG